MKKPKTSTGHGRGPGRNTFHTPSAFHAYDIAARFRSRGVCVAMGGPHVTLLPEEASQFADVIFIGEAEGLWEDFLRDFESGTHLRRYEQTSVPSLENIPQAHRGLFHRRDHTNGVLFATRGCPGLCDFCAVAVMYRHQLRKRPIAEVAAEYASFKGNVIIFWDDNIAADMEYSKRLFRAIAPYRKWWSSQASIHAGRDDEFLEAAAHSGCKQLFLGLESISQQSMIEVNKGFNRVEEYLQIIRRIHLAWDCGASRDCVWIRSRYAGDIRGHHRFPGKSGSAECDFQHSDAIPRYAAVSEDGNRRAYIDARLAQIQ